MNKNSERLRKHFSVYSSDNNHLPLMFLAMEATKGEVYEFGMGHGSTPYLFEYCIRNKRTLNSYETVQEWADKFENLKYSNFHINVINVLSWDVVVDDIYGQKVKGGVILVDNAPGESRKDILAQLVDFDGVIVAHDTEKEADGGYQMRQHFSKYKYVLNYKSDGAEATAMSNTIDVTKWIGERFGENVITQYQG